MSKRLVGIFIAFLALTVTAFFSPAQIEAQGCYSVLLPRLQVGIQGRVTPGLPNVLRSQPYRGYDSIVLGEIPAGGLFTVMGGPNCYDGMNWWMVNYLGTIGWTPEGSNSGVYWTEPVNFSDGCMSIVTRLNERQAGRVLPGLPNVLRSQPHRGAGSTILANMPAGAIFQVLSGVSCSEGMSWWQVNYGGMVGWTPEGQGYEYWLEPFGGSPYCALPIHMVLDQAGIVSPGLPHRLRAQPSFSGQVLTLMNAGETFYVLAGATCAEGVHWWQVNYRGTVGWTAEGDDGVYWIDPLVCPGFMPSRMSVGRLGRVTAGLPNRLRTSPSTAAQVITLMPGGAIFGVIGGVVCSENGAWWQVNYNGTIGWTLEGQGPGIGNIYWLEPIG